MTGYNVSEPFIEVARKILVRIKNKDIDPESELVICCNYLRCRLWVLRLVGSKSSHLSIR